MVIEKLNWDTEFFGIKIGRLLVTDEKDFDPIEFVERARDEKYELVYIFKYSNMFTLPKVLKANLDLVDIMLTMSKKFNKNEYKNIPYNFRTSLSKQEIDECYYIAEKTAKVSRFYNDNKIGIEKTKALYRKWIDNALDSKFSDGIFLEKEMDKVVGIHLLKTDKKNNLGYFTLSGVNPEYKRMGIGYKLWLQSFGYWGKESDISIIKSPFSFQNVESFNFHLKMGFQKTEEIKFIYHYRNNYSL